MEDAAAPEAEVGSISDEPCTMADEDALDGLSEDEAKMELLVVAAADDDGELLILLDRPRFKMLALFRTALVPLAAPRERLEVNAGELLGCSELTGVAIRVGVTSLLVMMATVVLRDRLRDKAFCRIRLLGLNKLGRMTGLNVLLDREKVRLELGAGLIMDWSSSSSTSVSVDSSEFSKSSTELEARMKSSSISLKSAAEAEAKEELETNSDDDKLGVTEIELGANVVSTSPDSNSGTIEVSSPSAILFSSASKSPTEGSSVASMPMPTDVGKICKESVTVAANMSVLVSSRLVITVLSPSMEVVQ